MSQLSKGAKRLIPLSLQESARRSYYSLQRARQWPAANFHPWRRSSMHHLADLKNTYQGKRCFVIGNGPSLKHTDLSRLQAEYTFGMNRIYLLFPELGFTTSFFLSVNDLVIEQCVTDILALPIPKFLSWRSHNIFLPVLGKEQQIPETPPLIFLHTTYTGPRFATDARQRIWEGATVTYVALQLAFHMGFSQVILIGVDHNFTTQGKPNTTVISQGDDPDHFAGNYFGKGFRWQLPDLDTSERAYAMAQSAYRHSGREILDATVGGKLTIFPKVEYGSLFL